MNINRACSISKFSKIKPLSIKGVFTAKNNTITSQTQKNQWEIKNAMEAVLGGLLGCEAVTLRAQAAYRKIKIGEIRFNKVKSQYDLMLFKKGGPANKFSDVRIQAQIECNCSQEQLDQMKKQVQLKCPVFQVITGSGVKVQSKWQAIRKSDL